MTSEIAIVLTILGLAIVLFITERVRVDIVALIVLTQGLMLIAFGVQAEYLAHIVSEVKRRPEYVVREVVGGPRDEGGGDLGGR